MKRGRETDRNRERDGERQRQIDREGRERGEGKGVIKERERGGRGGAVRVR